MRAILGLALALALGGCGISSVHTPGVGWASSDPPALTARDKELQTAALNRTLQQRRAGDGTIWFNEDSGRWGKIKITRLNPGLLSSGMRPSRGSSCSPYGCRPSYGRVLQNLPLTSLELSEEIYSDGDIFITENMVFCRGGHGGWYRYR
jgi:hypothetical protein